ncbi:MAG: hypothetical protein ABL984_14460 [Pyrinomonadaceae bacterium]
MPINIYRDVDEKQEVAWLCDDSWELPVQIDALSSWIGQQASELNDGPYVADIGFSVRSEASGGGAVLEPGIMKLLAEADVSIFLSEYAGDRPKRSGEDD